MVRNLDQSKGPWKFCFVLAPLLGRKPGINLSPVRACVTNQNSFSDIWQEIQNFPTKKPKNQGVLFKNFINPFARFAERKITLIVMFKLLH